MLTPRPSTRKQGFMESISRVRYHEDIYGNINNEDVVGSTVDACESESDSGDEGGATFTGSGSEHPTDVNGKKAAIQTLKERHGVSNTRRATNTPTSVAGGRRNAPPPLTPSSLRSRPQTVYQISPSKNARHSILLKSLYSPVSITTQVPTLRAGMFGRQFKQAGPIVLDDETFADNVEISIELDKLQGLAVAEPSDTADETKQKAHRNDTDQSEPARKSSVVAFFEPTAVRERAASPYVYISITRTNVLAEASYSSFRRHRTRSEEAVDHENLDDVNARSGRRFYKNCSATKQSTTVRGSRPETRTTKHKMISRHMAEGRVLRRSPRNQGASALVNWMGVRMVLSKEAGYVVIG